MAVAAPVIEAEMDDWVALGGGNSGIVGDRNHSYGFHLAANEVPPDDYSRWRDPNGSDGPYVDWDYACAGDFRHGGNEDLRALHRRVLARLMAGEMPMICEFIGQPWANQPVYYWARWLGTGTLQRYTGAGHDLWSHISWFRSRVDEPAGLWREGGGMDLPIRLGDRGENVKRAQYIMYRLGYDPAVVDDKTKEPISSTRYDGIYGKAMEEQVRRYRADHGIANAKGDVITGWTMSQMEYEQSLLAASKTAAGSSTAEIAAIVRAELAKLTATTTIKLG